MRYFESFQPKRSEESHYGGRVFTERDRSREGDKRRAFKET